MPQIRIERVSVTATNGNQEAENMTEIGRGIGVEVAERDHDDDREQGERCDRSLDQAGDMPFDLPALVAAMSRTGIGGDDGRWPMQWE